MTQFASLHRPGSGGKTLRTLLKCWCLVAIGVGASHQPAYAVQDAAKPPPPAALPSTADLAYVERLYHSGDAFRAESEALRFLYMQGGHPRATEIELLRAKLYYRQGRYKEASLFLYSLLDRAPAGKTRQEAARLLAFARLRQGQELAGEDLVALVPRALPHSMREPLRQEARMGAPPGKTISPERAKAWSTWIPGAGFIALGQPGKGSAAMGLNLALIYGMLNAYQIGNPATALVFLVAELSLYQGGRAGAAQEAGKLRDQEAEQWREDLLHRLGEAEMLATGLLPD